MAVRSDQVVDPIGLHPLEHWVSIPSLGEPRDRIRPGRIAVPGDSDAEEHREDREAGAILAGDEVLDRGQDAVPRAALARRRPRERDAHSGHRRVVGVQAGALDQRLAELLGYLFRRVIDVPAGVGPADVDADCGDVAEVGQGVGRGADGGVIEGHHHALACGIHEGR